MMMMIIINKNNKELHSAEKKVEQVSDSFLFVKILVVDALLSLQ